MLKVKIIILVICFSFLLSCNHSAEKSDKKSQDDKNKTSEKVLIKNGKIPNTYSNLKLDGDGYLYLDEKGEKIYAQNNYDYKLSDFENRVSGSEKGLIFNFVEDFKGVLYYGFIPYGSTKFPQPVFFKKKVEINNGKAEINILDNLSGKYDMVGWEKTGTGCLGYRILNDKGAIIHDSRVVFDYTKNNFEVLNTILEGPFVNIVTPSSAVISFKSSKSSKVRIKVNDNFFEDTALTTKHEIKIDNLNADSYYEYLIDLNPVQSVAYKFRTSQKKGSKSKFSFAYASDSRNGQGGGERDIFGVNSYILKHIMAFSKMKNVRFLQFSGDLINGYRSEKDEINLEYSNFKHAIELFGSYFPVYLGMGNHEALIFKFGKGSKKVPCVDKFPYSNESAESVFADNFVMPINSGLESEGEGFPSYKENVYYYIYGNTAVIVLNSNYWYSPSISANKLTSGNLHAYIMDKQLVWLEKNIQKLESDSDIDHIFVTQHTPAFPNGGHSTDDMWYNGNNSNRVYINGIGAEKGIIERRDQYLDILVNKSNKVVGILTGDEHNYNVLTINDKMPRYPKKYSPEKINLSRTIYQINNGAAGAPYYAQELLPWSDNISVFSTQNAVVIITVEGSKVGLETYNPETFELLDKKTIRN